MSFDLYAENVLDHYRNPRNKGVVEKPDVVCRAANPSCGDAVSFQLRVSDGMIVEAKFQGSGCAISQASASMLSEKICGSRLQDVLQMGEKEVLGMLGVEITRGRVKCAILGLSALKNGFAQKEKYFF